MATSVEDEHRLIENACEQLEVLADELPALPPPPQLESLIVLLRDAIPAHCRHEEDAIRAPLADPEAERLCRGALNILIDEHATNEAIAHELADALEDCMDAATAPAPEALGQLARQFFVLMRRHMAWEEFVLHALLQIEHGEAPETPES